MRYNRADGYLALRERLDLDGELEGVVSDVSAEV